MSAGYQELISKVYRSLSSLTGYKGVAGHLHKLVRYKYVTDYTGEQNKKSGMVPGIF